MARVVLLTVEGDVDLLPSGTSVSDILQEPIYQVKVACGFSLMWSSSSLSAAQVNELGSAAAGQTIHGDAVLCKSSGDADSVNAFLRELQDRPSAKASKPSVFKVHVNATAGGPLAPPQTTQGTRREHAPPPSPSQHRPPSPIISSKQPATPQRVQVVPLSQQPQPQQQQQTQPPAKPANASTPQLRLHQLLNLRNYASLHNPNPPPNPAPPAALPLVSAPTAIPPARPATIPSTTHPPAPPRTFAPLTAAPTRKRTSAARRYTPLAATLPAPHPAKVITSLDLEDELMFGSLDPSPPTPPAQGTNWQDICALTISLIIQHLQGGVAPVVAMAGTCHHWRRAILEDPRLLRGLPFNVNPAAPFRSASCDCVACVRDVARRVVIPAYPELLDKAARAGNADAAVCIALLEERQGRAGEPAMRWWRRAAKAGHAGAQLRVGIAYYEASSGLHESPEDALIWLGRGLKQLPQTFFFPDGISGTSPPTPSLLQGPALPPFPPPPAAPTPSHPIATAPSPPSPPTSAASTATTVTPGAATLGNGVVGGGSERLAAVADHLVGRSCLIMGYLHFDGEGATRSRPDAVKYFKMAVAKGDKEAEEVLGWMYNTGQYG